MWLRCLFSFFLLAFYLYSPAQDCKDDYVNTNFALEICNNDGWSIQSAPPSIVVKSGQRKASIFGEPNPGNQSPKQICETLFDGKKKEDSTWRMIQTRAITVGGKAGWLNVMYRPAYNNGNSSQKALYNTYVVVLHNDLRYSINNNCYEENCEQSQQFVEKLAASIKLIDVNQDISDKDMDLLEVFTQNLFTALQNKNTEALDKLALSTEKIVEALSHSRDKELKEKMTKVFSEKKDEFNQKYVEPNKKILHALPGEAKKLGIKKWSAIAYTGTHYTPLKMQFGFKNIALQMDFTYKNKTYTINLAGLMLLHDGWYIAEVGSLPLVEKTK